MAPLKDYSMLHNVETFLQDSNLFLLDQIKCFANNKFSKRGM